MANLYCRPGLTTGANDGSDWTNAWRNFDQIVWGGSAGELGAGDTLWIAGGTTSQTFYFGANGTAGNVISIRRALASESACTSAAGWNAAFDSQLIIDKTQAAVGGYEHYPHDATVAEGRGKYSGFFWFSARAANEMPSTIYGSYVTIDGGVKSGILIKADGMGYDQTSGCVFDRTSGVATDKPCRDNQLCAWGFSTTSSPMLQGITLRYIQVMGPANGDKYLVGSRASEPVAHRSGPVFVRDGSSTGSGLAVDGLTVQYCEFWGGTSGGRLLGVTNVLIEHNDFHTLGNSFPDGAQAQAPYNYDTTPGSSTAYDAPHGSVISYRAFKNSIIRYNYFHHYTSPSGVSFYAGGSSGPTENVLIYNNVFYNPADADPVYTNGARGLGLIGNIGGGPIYFYNNTLVGINYPFTTSSAVPDNGIYIYENNILIGTNQWSSVTLGDGEVQHDYNWKETNWSNSDEPNHSLGANEGIFVGAPLGLNSVFEDFRLTSQSPGGRPLSSPFGLDPLGNPMGENGFWEHGAFSTLTGDPPPPPTEGAWYVDKNASGANNGSSWTDAWTSVGNINWGSIQPGDIIYISGGPTSKTYTPGSGLPANGIWTIGANGTSLGNRITFRVGQDAGHNGTVIFDYASLVSNNVTSARDVILADSRSYLTFNGEVNSQINWHFKNLYDVSTRLDGNIISTDNTTGNIFEYLRFENVNNAIIGQGSNNTTEVKNCTFFGIRGHAAVLLQGAGSSTKNLLHDNNVHLYCNNALGPDGFAVTHWTVIYDNIFRAIQAPGGLQTSDQHTDCIQLQGNNNQIYRNIFLNVGDACITILGGSTSVDNILIYNNLFRVEQPLSGGQASEFIRQIRTLATMNNFKILHNTFIDNTQSVGFRTPTDGTNTSTTGSGNEIKNNVFYRVGNSNSFTTATIYIDNNPTNWSFGGNSFFNDLEAGVRIHYKGNDYTYAQWVAAFESGTGQLGQPTFITYNQYSPSNDLRPAQGDTVLKGNAVSLTTSIPDDLNGITRPGGTDNDIGCYESSVVTEEPILNVSPQSLDFGVAQANVDEPTETIEVKNVGDGTLNWDATGLAAPFSIDSGSAGSTTSETDETVVRFAPTSEGEFIDVVEYDSGDDSAEVNLRGLAYVAEADLVLTAYDEGVLLAPLAISAGSHVSQPELTTLDLGGVWLVGFTVSVAGLYKFAALVDAPTAGSNSFWFAVDQKPTNDTFVWDIVNLTSGFETRDVSRRGAGSPSNPQFSPFQLQLGTGVHYLYIVGRESNCLLRSITPTLLTSEPEVTPPVPDTKIQRGLLLFNT